MKKKGSYLIVIAFTFLLAFSSMESPIAQSYFGIETSMAKTLKLNKTKVSLKKGETYQLKILGSSKKVKWKSTNSKIVTVNKKGKIKAKKLGKATIVAKIGKKQLKCKVVVKSKKRHHKNKIIYKSNVLHDLGEEKQNYTVSNEHEGSCIVAINKNKLTKKIKKNSIVILPDDQGNPYMALKVDQVRDVQDRIELEGVEPEIEEVFEDIDIATETEVPWNEFEYNDSVISDVSYTSSSNLSDKLYGTKLNSSYSIGDNICLTLKDSNLGSLGNVSGKIIISAPTLKSVLDIDIDGKQSVINQMQLSLNETVSTNINISLEEGVIKEIFLGHITVPIKDGFNADVIFYLKIAANGEAQVCNKTSVCAGIEYANQKVNPIYQPNISFDGTKAEVETTALMTPQLQIRWLGVWDEEKHDAKWTVEIVKTELDFGIGVKALTQVYNTKPYSCEEIQIYAILKIAIEDDYGLGKEIAQINKKIKKQIPISWELLGNNGKNKWRVIWHYEDGVRTKNDTCTRKTKSKRWSEYKYDILEYDGYLYYFINNVLYKSPKALYEKNVREEVTRWKINEKYPQDDEFRMINGSGNLLYVEIRDVSGCYGRLDVVNVKTGAKSTAIKSFGTCLVKGMVGEKYIYGYRWPITDVSANQINVWKMDQKGIHKIKKLGDWVFGVYISDNKLYYGVYPTNKLSKVSIYSSNLDGSSPKKLLSLELKGEYAQILMNGVKDNKITIYESLSQWNGLYEYDLKTKKLKSL